MTISPPATVKTAPFGKVKPTHVAVERSIDGLTTAQLWDAYNTSFEHLRDEALLLHSLDRDEFDELMDDERVLKVVAYCAGRAVGLGMLTNHLEIAPQISPRFLRRRYPHLAQRNAIYVGILVFVSAERRKQALFAQVAGAMGQIAAHDDGVLIFDICDWNNQEHNLGSQLESVASWFPDSSFAKIDAQTFYAARFPLPAARLPFGVEQVVEADLGIRRESFDIDLTA